MFRYFALVWNQEDQAQRDAAELLTRRLQRSVGVWNTCLDDFGIKVLYTGIRHGSQEPYVLRACAGAVLGTVFSRDVLDCEGADLHQGLVRFTEQESLKILSSQGRRLIEAYWGRYVAFLCDSETDTKWILRDPGGGLPCYTTRFRGVSLYFNSIEDCVQLQLLPFSVDWPLIADHLTIGAVRSRQTGLNEVTEIYPGECVQICHGRIHKSSYWEPQKFITGDSIESPERAAIELRRTTQQCIFAWASRFDGVMVKLSGGLDSSIVLSCLARAPSHPKITCINYYAHTEDSDERAFARAMAKRADVTLLEREWNAHVPLEGILSIARSPRPAMSWARIQHARYEAELASRTGCSAMFGGEGGDERFYQTNVNLTAADFAASHGLRRELLAIALNAAYCSGTSIWSVLRDALKYGMQKKRIVLHDAPAEIEPLVNRSLITRANAHAYDRHPWLRSLQDIPPGKVWQIYALSFTASLHDPMEAPDQLDRIEPLELSQPLTELCLRIPTYVLARDGWDRAIARGAFAQDLPEQITFRHTKGGPDDGLKRLLAENLPFVREMLLDGLLVRHQLLDRRRLETVLSHEPSQIFCGVGEILSHLSTEAWLRRWSEVRVRAAA